MAIFDENEEEEELARLTEFSLCLEEAIPPVR